MRRSGVVVGIAVALVGCTSAGFSTAKYCPAAQAAEDSSRKLQSGAAFSTPGGGQAAFSDLIAKARAARDLAPATIKTDLATIVAAAEKVDAALVKVGYDFTKLDPATQQILNDKTINDAADRIGAYNKTSCPGFRSNGVGGAASTAN